MLPEIVEVEIQVRGLQNLIGKTITEVEVLEGSEPLINFIPDVYESVIAGCKIERIMRSGKHIIFQLTKLNGNVVEWWYLSAHLAMTGGFLIDRELNHTRMIYYFEDGYFVYNDIRKFGRVNLYNADEIVNKFTGKIGVDPLKESAYEIEMALVKSLFSYKGTIKELLLDQSVICGLGNIYVCEALWHSLIRPDRNAKDITLEDAKVISLNIKKIIQEAVLHGGSSIKDYMDVNGKSGNYQDYHQAYGRKGKPCAKCGYKIVSMKISNRNSFYCQECQI